VKDLMARAWRSVRDASGAGNSGLRFLALALWVSVAGGLWLEQVAVNRRLLETRESRLEDQKRREWLINLRLERIANGLQEDPALIEREARRLGYGRRGEFAYPLTARDLRSVRLNPAEGAARGLSWSQTLIEAAGSAAMLLIAGVIAILFFTDLRVDDHLPRSTPPPGGAP
jgi:hypothetical protein